MSNPQDGLSYSDSGVDIDAGNALVDRIKPVAKSTHRAGVVGGLGGFGALFDLKACGYADPILVGATDGVGTKLRLAIETGRLGTVGIDLVAMCVNDLICQGAEPLFFLDYLATGALEVEDAAQVIGGIGEGCRLANCALIGGETAEMPGMYARKDFDLAGFCLGALERGAHLPARVAKGDVLLGIGSSGVHSNGFSLVRRIVEHAGLSWQSPAPWCEASLGEAFLTPTVIYVQPAMGARKKESGIHAFAHITGGGLLENIPRVLPEGLGAEISLDAWPLPAPFCWLADAGGVAETEMLRTFNCGIGLVVVVAEQSCDPVRRHFEAAGHAVTPIGHVRAGQGVSFAGSMRFAR